ncbi:Cna B-type domain-containing protein [Streptococcus anginosus]|uniref:Cna B-type domain-containing protein n=1 Tax=Streptococcus anginosus TaxID=1328 RepID=UPI001C8B67F1|nr:Cna B-type domain-containing protein [Streptococcus anginosus]MBX9075724.1 Cna B-type domain-containing protein [Streptococcus anginosus]
MRLKEWMSFFLSLLMIFAFLGFWNVQRVSAADVTNKAKIEDLKITIASTGSETEGIHGSNDTSMKLKYSGKFSFPNVAVNEIKDGDYFIVKAPNNLSLTDGSLDLIDSTSNTKMGTVQVDNANHQLVFTFNDKVKDKQNIRGDFVAEATETLQKEGKTVTYVLPDGKKQTITYKVNKYKQTDVIGETITKYGYNDNNKARAHFQMKINRAKKDMTGHVVKITDDVSKGAFANYVEGTFSLHEAEFETTNKNSSALKHLGDEYEITTDPEVYKANSDKKALLTFVNGKRGFELLMPTNMGKKSFFLTYDTSSPADTSTISNSAQYLIDNQPQLIWENYGGSIGTRTEATFNLKTVKSVGASVTADIAGKIKITKYDEADADVKLEGVEFDIIDKATNKVVQTVPTDKDGIALSKALNDGKYIVKEKTPKPGYQVNSQEFEVELKGGQGVPLNISNKRVTVDFEATKTWVNGKATDYKEVKLGLYVHKEGQTVADAKPVTGNYTPEVTVSNGVYTYKWKNQLPERDVDGSKLVYSVRELEDQTGLPLKEGEKVKAGENNYLVSYNADKTQVTNTYEVPKTKVTAKKVWSGGKADARPKFYFKLYRTLKGGTEEAVADAEKKEVPKTDGTVEWTNLPATDANAKKYTYSVKEVDAQEKPVTTVSGYTANQTDATTVTNTYKLLPTKTDIFVDKELTGNRPTPLQADEFEFILKDEKGTEVQRAKNDANGHVAFKDIPFDKEGQYKFTIVEAHAGQTINGVTHDSRSVHVTVSVYDPGQGKLVATPLYNQISALIAPFANFASSDSSLPPGAISVIDNGGIQKFVNTYKATEVKVPVAATKTLINKNTNEPIQLKGGEFEFTLTDSNGVIKDTKKNDKDGNVQFKELEFDKAGVYKYTIKEVKGGTTEKGTTYDGKTVNVTITVTDDSKGALKAAVSYDNDDKHFENTYEAEKAKASLEVMKKLTGRNLEADMFEFTLTNTADNSVQDTQKNGADGKVKFKELTFEKAGTYTYAIKEVKAGTTENNITYDAKTVTAKVTVTDDGKGKLSAAVEYSSDASDGSTTFTNVYTPAKTQVSVTKVWDDDNNQDGLRPTKITVNLLADGVKLETKEIQAAQDGTWSATFTDLPKYKDDKEIKYTVTEEPVEGYVSEITADTATNFTIKNTHAPATVSVQGTKTWDDGNNQDGKRPDKIKVLLNKTVDGVTTKVAEQEVTKANWTYEFKNLPKFEGGKEITYSIDEEAVEGYVKAIDGYNLKNSYTPAKTQIPVKKVWNDADNQDGKRPTSITVKLLADGTDTGKTLELSEANGWAGSFTELDAHKGGKAIDYKVVEATSITGYTTEVTGDAATGFTITNSYTPETIDIKATKNWDDANNQDGKRPKYITVNLLADGEKVASKEVKAAADGTWSTVFTKLPKFKAGKVIKYSLTEEVVSEYTSEINDFNITNKYTPKMIDYQVTKTWNDNNNQDGKRPDHITVHLMKTVGDVTTEVEKYDIKVAEADPANGNVWKHTFSNLPKYEVGQEIVYSVKEDAVAGYETSIKGQEITNTHTPETIVISGKKVWEDNNNQDGKRTATVKVQILKGKEIVDEIETSEEKGWAFESKPLPKYENGQEIKYDVKEVAVESYEKPIVEKSQDGKYTITNKRTPEKVNLTGQKTWNDANNQDNIRPTEIKVRLLADGKDTDKVATASAATGWKYSFEGLDRYKDGKEIVYSVKEVKVPEGYTSKANGMNLTNNHTPATTSVSGQKIWDDDNDKDGLRPKEIQVRLLANSKDTGKVVTVSEATGWKYSFEKLAKYEAGKEITYTVEEVAVPEGYTAKVDGMNITNRHTPEKPQTPPSTPEKSKKKILPSTGSQNSFFALLAGLFTLSGAAYLLKKKA